MTRSSIDFGARDFSVAWSLVPAAGALLSTADLARLGLLGCGVSGEAIAAAGASAVPRAGSGALVGGFLLGLSLRCLVGIRCDAGIGEAVPQAVDRVHASGRQSIIARCCDLAAVAVSERALAASLLTGKAPERHDNETRARVERCFELGLAVALVLEPAVGDSG